MAFDFPDSPSLNQTYSEAGRTWIWDGTTWNSVSLAANTSVSSTPPAGPSIGDTWFDTTSAKLFVYYDSFWVEAAGGVVGPPGVVSATSPVLYNDQTQNVSIDRSQLAGVSPNYIINGAFDIWQRGTSFANPASGTYLVDRFTYSYSGTGATRTLSRQAFTPAELPTPSLGESEFYFRFDQSVAGTGNTFNTFVQRIEDVRTLAGQTATISFYAKAASAATMPLLRTLQRFGSGGSAVVTTTVGSSIQVGTDWQRFIYTATIPSVSGKTIGAGSSLELQFFYPPGETFTIDLWGVQLEAGSVATPFRRNANSIQGELAACQRYFERLLATTQPTLQSVQDLESLPQQELSSVYQYQES
jgi:hypothetical protein